jgi:hypothetical protein
MLLMFDELKVAEADVEGKGEENGQVWRCREDRHGFYY